MFLMAGKRRLWYNKDTENNNTRTTERRRSTWWPRESWDSEGNFWDGRRGVFGRFEWWI